MHEYVRPLLFFAGESAGRLAMDFVTRFQVTLLHAAGSLYCGAETMISHGLDPRSELAIYFLNSRMDLMLTAKVPLHAAED
jgi:hypothetical protein